MVKISPQQEPQRTVSFSVLTALCEIRELLLPSASQYNDISRASPHLELAGHTPVQEVCYCLLHCHTTTSIMPPHLGLARHELVQEGDQAVIPQWVPSVVCVGARQQLARHGAAAGVHVLGQAAQLPPRALLCASVQGLPAGIRGC